MIRELETDKVIVKHSEFSPVFKVVDQQSGGDIELVNSVNVVFLPPTSIKDEAYRRLKESLYDTQQALAQSAARLNIRSDDDVFKYLNGNSILE